jgi:N,N'-diacetyllegionaminate synthase
MDFRNLDRTWIVAEIGVNHEGSVSVAENLIERAAESGADAVKFQTFKVEHYVSSVQPERFERARKFQLPYEAFAHLAGVAQRLGLTFFSTPLHYDDVDFLDGIAPIFKVSSGDLTHLNLIRRIASKGKPIIVSTGLGTLEEIRAAIDAIVQVRPDIAEKGELALLHCVAAYPTPLEEAGLGNIGLLRDSFGLPVGYSDHSLGIKACELAVAAGAVVIEKHFTYRKENQAFHDHALSADPSEMRDLVETIRQVESIFGRRERRRTPSEEKMVLHLRRSVGAARDIPEGVPVRVDDLTLLRPAWGLQVDELEDLIGKRLNRTVSAGQLIMPEDVERSM